MYVFSEPFWLGIRTFYLLIIIFWTFIPHLNYMILDFLYLTQYLFCNSLGLSVILDYRNLSVELKTNVLRSVL